MITQPTYRDAEGPDRRAIQRVLVTGAGGQLGRVVTTDLQRRSLDVVGLSLGLDSSFPASAVHDADATDAEAVRRAVADVDGVIHLAALAHPSLGEPYDVFRTNSNATFNVLNEAARVGVGRAVIASSINAWGVPLNPHNAWPAQWPINEDEVHQVADPYSLSKLVDEEIAAMMHRRHHLNVVAVRLPFTKGRTELIERARIVQGDPPIAAREGWSYLDERDTARTMVEALLQPLPPGAHTVLLSAADTLLTMSTAEAVAAYTPEVPLRRPVVGNGTLLDCSRARRLLDFRPQYSIHAPEPPAGTVSPSASAVLDGPR
jgi:nucleoside-diphosphate-sugar epimerase